MIKWLGNHVVDFIARFRNDVYLERISTGTIASGAHLGLDSNNKIVKAADGGGDLTSIVAGTGLSGTSLTGPDVTLNVDASQTQITSVGTIGTGVWNGDAISHAYVGANAIETDNIADAQVTVAKLHADAVQTSGESFADNDTSLMTSAAIDDAIIKGGSTTIIKVLPYNFMSNEDGGANKSVQFRDDTIIGVRATANDSELYAFVEIPIGKTATAVIVYGNDSGNVVEVFESDINAGALTDKTHASGCVVGTACDITDVAADATNYLVIKVTITSYTNDIVYGAAVTISG